MEDLDQVQDNQEQKQQHHHQCKLCNKSFANGKVLGGHMRSHRSRSKIPAKKRKKTSIAAAYSLRENPKKSWKFSSPPIPQTLNPNPQNLCKICSKSFDSSKALFGHMRHHSGKRKQSSIKDLELPKGKRSTRTRCKLGSSNSSNSSCCSDDFVPFSSDSGVIEPDVHDLALCLLMLSNGLPQFGAKFGIMPKLVDDECDESEMGFGENVGENGVKSFVGVCEEQEVGSYECDVCLKVFGSGRALGGHKRAHFVKPNLMELDEEIVVDSDDHDEDVEKFKPWWNDGDDDDNGGLQLVGGLVSSN